MENHVTLISQTLSLSARHKASAMMAMVVALARDMARTVYHNADVFAVMGSRHARIHRHYANEQNSE